MKGSINRIAGRSTAPGRRSIAYRLGRRLGALVLVLVIVGALPVLAATVDLTIPIETIVRGPDGSQHVLAVVDVPAESRGEVCTATAIARNQDSEHPDSHLLISSATSLEILDVENTAYGSVFGGGTITLGETVTVTLTLGPDRVFSGGLDLVIDCPPLSPTTTTTTTSPPPGDGDGDGSTSPGDGDGDGSTSPGDGDGSTSPGDGDGDGSPGDGDGDGDGSPGDGDGSTSPGDGDGDGSTSPGDGDGDGSTSPGDGDGDGSTSPGDGDGDGSTSPGDGDGDGSTSPGDGDGDGSTSPGDGDGDGSTSPGDGDGDGSTSPGDGDGDGSTSPGDGDGDGGDDGSEVSDQVGPTGPTVGGTSITAPSSTAVVSAETLPFTGLTGQEVGGLAFAMLALGGLLVLSVLRRENEVVVVRNWQRRVDFYDVRF